MAANLDAGVELVVDLDLELELEVLERVIRGEEGIRAPFGRRPDEDAVDHFVGRAAADDLEAVERSILKEILPGRSLGASGHG